MSQVSKLPYQLNENEVSNINEVNYENTMTPTIEDDFKIEESGINTPTTLSLNDLKPSFHSESPVPPISIKSKNLTPYFISGALLWWLIK